MNQAQLIAQVAEHFHKHHRNVMQSISMVECSTEFSLLNFQQSTYTNKRGKTYPMCRITRDGFSFLAMGFTGKEAARWKEDFLAAFNLMEVQLRAQKDREANALYRLRPKWQPIVLHPDLNRQKLIGLTGHKSPGSITSCRRRMREIGLLPI